MKWSQTYKFKYGLSGVIFGCCFPIIAVGMDLYRLSYSITWDHILSVQAQSPIHYIINTAPFFLGIIAYMAGIRQDKIEELNRHLSLEIDGQKKSLIYKNKQLEEYSYIATHNLKTPIANIEGFYKLLCLELKQPNVETQELIQGLGKGILQAKSTLVDLISIMDLMSLIEPIESLSLTEVAALSIDLYKEEIATRNIQVELDFSKNKTIQFGQKALETIFTHMLSNAIKYHAPNRSPWIKIQAELNENFHLITIEDNGIGIDLSTQKEKIFGLFKQAQTTVKGAGVGLFVCKQIVERYGGHLDIESELDVGTKLFIYIPKIIIQ